MVYEKPTANNSYFDSTAERVYGFSTVVSGCGPVNVRLGLLNSVGTQKNIAAVRPTGTAKKSAAATPAISTPQLQQVNQVVAQQPVGPAAAARPAPAPQSQPVTLQATVPVAAPTTSTPAKSTASYEDTMTWLKGKIESEGGYAVTSSLTFTDTGEVQTGTNTFNYAVTSTESCHLRWNNPTTRTGNTMSFELAPSSVNLSELAPNIKVQQTHDLMGPPFSSGNITPRDPSYVIVALTKNENFIFADTDIAQRVANALNHAIEVCGGKSKRELF